MASCVTVSGTRRESRELAPGTRGSCVSPGLQRLRAAGRPMPGLLGSGCRSPKNSEGMASLSLHHPFSPREWDQLVFISHSLVFLSIAVWVPSGAFWVPSPYDQGVGAAELVPEGKAARVRAPGPDLASRDPLSILVLPSVAVWTWPSHSESGFRPPSREGVGVPSAITSP